MYDENNDVKVGCFFVIVLEKSALIFVKYLYINIRPRSYANVAAIKRTRVDCKTNIRYLVIIKIDVKNSTKSIAAAI